MMALNTTSGKLTDHQLPSVQRTPYLCTRHSNIKVPYLFAQLVPKDNPVWDAFAREFRRGVEALFEEAMRSGVLDGHSVRLIPFEYSDSAQDAVVRALDRYPFLLGTMGSVVLSPTTATLQPPTAYQGCDT